MNAVNHEKLILKLIQANLTNEKLVLGLIDLHINDPAIYCVDLADSVLSLIGFTDLQAAFIHEYYELQMSRSRLVSLENGILGMKSLTEKVYEELLRFKAFHDKLYANNTSTDEN